MEGDGDYLWLLARADLPGTSMRLGGMSFGKAVWGEAWLWGRQTGVGTGKVERWKTPRNIWTKPKRQPLSWTRHGGDFTAYFELASICATLPTGSKRTPHKL